MLPVAILAGGLATRLRPITEKMPKALSEVAGQPFICRQLHCLRDQAVRRVVLGIGYLGEQIETLIGNGAKFGLDVRYVPDGPTLLGTGGALRQAPQPEMEYIDYGLGIMSARTLIGYPENQPFDLAEVYHRLSLEGQLMGYEVHERFYEIGSPSGLRETEEYFLLKGKS